MVRINADGLAAGLALGGGFVAREVMAGVVDCVSGTVCDVVAGGENAGGGLTADLRPGGVATGGDALGDCTPAEAGSPGCSAKGEVAGAP